MREKIIAAFREYPGLADIDRYPLLLQKAVELRRCSKVSRARVDEVELSKDDLAKFRTRLNQIGTAAKKLRALLPKMVDDIVEKATYKDPAVIGKMLPPVWEYEFSALGFLQPEQSPERQFHDFVFRLKRLEAAAKTKTETDPSVEHRGRKPAYAGNTVAKLAAQIILDAASVQPGVPRPDRAAKGPYLKLIAALYEILEITDSVPERARRALEKLREYRPPMPAGEIGQK